MIPISAQLKAHLATSRLTVATCWKVTRTDGVILGFTDHDSDLVVGGVTYATIAGYKRTDIASASDLSVDNLEVAGPAELPSVTEYDLHAGVWDFASVLLFFVNYEDLTQGVCILRSGKLGEVSVMGSEFSSELRGLAQAYTRMIGDLTSPGCRNTLGDSRCQVNLATGSPSFTVTGTITGVNADNQTIFDSSRTEAGPSGGVTVVTITKANPGVVTTLGTPIAVPAGSPITIHGALGMPEVNGVWILHHPSGVIFDIGADTSSFGVYTGSSGTATPLGGDTGYFDGGVMTFTGPSGCLNIGLSMEVRSYVPGQITLQLPMPYQVQVGDTYSMTVGCDKSLTTCHDRFGNVVNFRGEPYLPGIDKVSQIGKQ